jgi:hypothetical protein
MPQDDGQVPMIEALESRRLMSTSVFLGLDCLPAADAPAPGDDHGLDTPDPTPTPSPDPKPTIRDAIPLVTGSWTGSQVKADDSLGAELSLVVWSPADGELNASIDLHGARRIRWRGQMMYNAQTGHLTMYYLSTSLIAKLDVTLTTDGQQAAPKLEGTIEYYTPDGSYSATLTLLRAADA